MTEAGNRQGPELRADVLIRVEQARSNGNVVLHREANMMKDDEDPVLQMWGVGKEIWKEEDGDAFIARERSAMDAELENKSGKAPIHTGSTQD